MRDIPELVSYLQEARDAYYNGDPFITDPEFDALEDELRERDPKNAYFAAVGAPTKTSGWQKVKHGAPMGSLMKVQTPEEMDAWVLDTQAKIEKARQQKMLTSPVTDLVITEKLDGISISLRYDKGNLIQALTRGDGTTGEDITRNVLLMQGVQATMRDFTGYVRGEIVLRKSDHQKHLSEYKNPRNAASGIAKRESDPAPCKHLTVIVYQVISEHHNITQKSVELKLLKKLGCIVPRWKLVKDAKSVQDVYVEYIHDVRSSLDYEIDGLVVEYDSLDVMENLGEHDGRPKGARAFKFPHSQLPSKLRDIVWQVGNSGRVTPVAYFEPVLLAGATVSQASLHNISNIRRIADKAGQKWLGKDDSVLVSRRNDVIPFVESLLTPAKSSRFVIPTACPSCAASLVMQGEYLVCENTKACPAQQSGAILRWVAKLDIKDVGETLIVSLCASGKVRSIADMYKLTVADLEDFQMSGKRLGTSSAQRVVDNLHAKMELRLADFVGALGINLCGQTVCQIIVDAGFDTLEKMEDATVAQFSAIPGMGSTKAEAFVDGFRRLRKAIDLLLGVGIQIKAVVTGGPLEGTSFCFTGIRDKDLEDRIKNAGGTIKGSVGAGLTYLVAKDPKSGSGKLQKAQSLGVQVIGLEAARQLVGP